MKFSFIKKNKAFHKCYMKVGVKKLLRTVPARAWRAHAVGMARTERLKLRREVAAAAGKKRTTSMYLVFNWRKSSPLWPLRLGQKEFGYANGVQDKKEEWTVQIFEVQTWRQVRGPAGAVMRETPDLGMK